ncbi:alpha/beta fold hydrolase [Streptosporangium roseum]|uniref:alpha/beta fold hydrolase n=1 Tax=Streptosporangium roseum TaxID=2001 RepID=UPI0004CCFB1C|nr:alpha/beta hydrolase [Streptosporangium roseum]
MAFTDLGDVRLFHTDDGAGDTTLLLVHGLGSDSHEWVHHIPSLAERYRVLAVDMRGHGYSSAPETGNAPRQMAEDLALLCGTLGVESCVAIGHSMGGQIVSHLAVEHPSLVKALVTVDPGYGFTGAVAASFPALIERMREDPVAAALRNDQWTSTGATPQWLREWHRRRILATPPHVLLQAFEAMFGGPEALGVRPNSDGYLSRRACPVLTFWFDPAQAEWEADLFKDPHSKAVTWEGSGHRLHEERPGEFLLVVTHWLRSLA